MWKKLWQEVVDYTKTQLTSDISIIAAAGFLFEFFGHVNSRETILFIWLIIFLIPEHMIKDVIAALRKKLDIQPKIGGFRQQ